jgi:MAF protein
LSHVKARAVAGTVTERHPGPLVAADTIVVQHGQILGKPEDAAEARAMLEQLRRSPHAVFTGVTLLDPGTEREETVVARTAVEMRPYTNAEIAAYVASGDPFDKAGGYAIQNEPFSPVLRIRGCYANVVGLPLCHLTRTLRRWEIEPPCDVPAACQRHTERHCTVYPAILAGQDEHSSL